ncbi:hypothetical protein FHX82_004458 [Amycolatopsis bartoniae]|uniref:DUF1707 domain-containing protein n=1 Tax=Amycolatopsis bartoniae TaxID=941986 RepID=A0A8H9IYK1_9PSEU|nr:DUF1707 domain-containing protein [Amycolatopsis bartoniae]MBB2937385.1 hypothetical protein [Amycolatopsis bartoniae]TVT01627.1 DUF1707 domain-containing protein [Amycolatopsis bartoniae]GHF78622.1 hypothetical protein GCM10017566_61170 [Amycolatopsis bartoniae]
MNEVPSPDLRIGDSERESALSALGEHLSAGRLDVDEYGDRSARVAAARTRGELAEVFADLPEPHPVFGTPPPAPAKAVQPKPPGAVAYSDRPLSQRVSAAMMPVLFAGAIVLGITTGIWWFIALPFLFGAFAQGIWGKDWDKDRRERDRRRHRS